MPSVGHIEIVIRQPPDLVSREAVVRKLLLHLQSRSVPMIFKLTPIRTWNLAEPALRIKDLKSCEQFLKEDIFTEFIWLVEARTARQILRTWRGSLKGSVSGFTSPDSAVGEVGGDLNDSTAF